MAALTAPAQPPRTEADREIWTRVDDYLRAHRVAAAQRERLVPAILAQAGARRAERPALALETLALDEAARVIDAWVARLIGSDAEESPARQRAHRVAALHLADVPGRWPEAFLAETPPPEELVARLREAYLEAAPEMEFSRMVPRPMDLGVVSAVADQTWRTFDKWPVLRGLLLWSLFGALLVGTFYVMRF